MQLLLIRHAIAADPLPGQDDALRPLTPKGAKRFRKVVKGVAEWMEPFDRLYHSPLLRAIQTAELALPLLSGESIVTPALTSEPDVQLLEMLQGERVIAIGHEPWMSRLTAWLLLGEVTHSPVFLFKKGGMALLEGDLHPGAMVLNAFLPPRISQK